MFPVKKYKDKECAICGKTFTPNCGVQKVCSQACKRERQRRREREIRGYKNRTDNPPVLYCAVCGEYFLQRVNGQKTCCKTCGKEWARWIAKWNGRRKRKREGTPSDQMRIRQDIPWSLDFDPWLCYKPVETNMEHVTWSQMIPVL